MKLRPWDYLALTAGSVAVWVITARVTDHLMDGHTRRETAGNHQAPRSPAAVNQPSSMGETAAPSPTPPVVARDPTELRQELAKLAAETLCAGADTEASRKCGRQFIMAAKSAGLSDEGIAAFLMDGMAASDPSLALYLLGMIQAPKPLRASQEMILKIGVAEDPVAAMRMILEFPPGERFTAALGTLAKNLPQDATLPGRVAELLGMLSEKRERDMLAQDISSALGDSLMSGRITKDYLKSVLEDKQTDTEVRYGIVSALWYDDAEQPSLEKAQRIMEDAGGEAGMVAWTITEELMRRGVSITDLLALARPADEKTLQRMLSPMLLSKRMASGELREAASLAARTSGPGNWNLLEDVASEAGRLDSSMDEEIATAIPADKRNAYRWAMVRRDLRHNDFARANANAESIEDSKSRAEAIESVNIRKRGSEGK
jgi:hypothetical protein